MNLVNRPVPAHSALEALYPREGFVPSKDGSMKPVFLGHPEALCDECERPFRLHRASAEYEGLIVICDGHLMRMTTCRCP